MINSEIIVIYSQFCLIDKLVLKFMEVFMMKLKKRIFFDCDIDNICGIGCMR